MKPTPAQIEALARTTQRQLGLNGWSIRVHIGEVPDDVNPGKRLAGASVSYPEYLSGDVYFDPEQIVFDHEDVASVVRHELLHIALSPMAAINDLWAANDPARERFTAYVNEQVTTALERMPLWDVADRVDL